VRWIVSIYKSPNSRSVRSNQGCCVEVANRYDYLASVAVDQDTAWEIMFDDPATSALDEKTGFYAVSGRVTNAATYSFTAPANNVYYLVLDNRANLFERNISVHVDRDSLGATEQSKSFAAMYRKRYAALRTLFIFPDFNIYVNHCGQVNAFSDKRNGDITICSEFIEEAQRQRLQGAESFAFLHEVAHSLLNLWDYPGWDNEDSADEFATVMLMLMNNQKVALEAAQFWASEDSGAGEIRAKLLAFDRHALSVQRARNIINWLGRENELERRWLHVMIPNMQTPALAAMVRRTRRAPFFLSSSCLPLLPLRFKASRKIRLR